MSILPHRILHPQFMIYYNSTPYTRKALKRTAFLQKTTSFPWVPATWDCLWWRSDLVPRRASLAWRAWRQRSSQPELKPLESWSNECGTTHELSGRIQKNINPAMVARLSERPSVGERHPDIMTDICLTLQFWIGWLYCSTPRWMRSF